MAKFEHRYGALTLQDDKGMWAQFTPAKRVVDGRDVTYGVLDTDDTEQIKRLRAVVDSGKDPDLREVAAPKAKATGGDQPPHDPPAGPAAAERTSDPNQVPTGNITDVLNWVGDDADRAARALTVEQAKGDRARSTLVADLEQIADQQQS